VATDLGKASARPEDAAPRPRGGAHAAAKAGRFRRGTPAGARSASASARSASAGTSDASAGTRAAKPVPSAVGPSPATPATQGTPAVPRPRAPRTPAHQAPLSGVARQQTWTERQQPGAVRQQAGTQPQQPGTQRQETEQGLRALAALARPEPGEFASPARRPGPATARGGAVARATRTAGGVTQTGTRAASVRSAVVGLVAAAVVAAVIPLAVLQIPDALAWSLPARYAGAGPGALASLLRAGGLALPAMAVAAPFGALATRRFRAGPVLLAGLLVLGAADVLGGSAQTVLLIGVDRSLHGLGAGTCLAAAAAIAAERSRAPRALGGWWAAVTVSGLAAAPELMRYRVSASGWPAALQPYPWLTGAALALAALYAFLAEDSATAAVRNAFPAADRAHLALLAAPIAGLGTITVAVTYRGEHAVAAAALAEAIALAALAGMAARASTAARLAVVGAATGFTLLPAAGTVAALARPSPVAGFAAVAAALAGAGLAALSRPAGPAGSAGSAGSAGPAGRVPVRALTAAGLLAATAGFGLVSLAGSAVVQPLVLALLCLPVAGGLAAALAGALRATSAGGAACGLVLLVTGVLAGYLAAGAVQLQALGQARTVTAVHAALIATSVRWGLVAAAVSGVAALVVACTPGRKSS
jgi:hypothetical protein